MPDKLELILEAERRGILPEDKKAVLEEARRRGLVPPRASAPQVPFYATGPEGQEVNLNDPANTDYRNQIAAENSQLEREKQERLANRGIMERMGDTAAFAASVPFRAATRGEYGLGDIVGAASKGAGESIVQAERGFAEANEGWLGPAAAIGEATAAIPALGTMGAPLRGMRATAAAMRASPRGTMAGAVRGTGEALDRHARQPGAIAGDATGVLPTAAGRLGRGLQAAADRIKPAAPRSAPSQAQRAGVPENIQTIPERLADIQAFRDLGMTPFAPATASTGAARLGRTIEELPVVGGTVKSPKTDVALQAQAAQAAMARQLGAPATEEAAGALAQRALDRYRTKGIADIEPGALSGGSPVGPTGPQRVMGINPYQPQRAAETLTEGAIERRAEAAPIRQAAGGGTAQTARGATVAAARPLNQIGLRRTNAEDLSEPELRRLIRAPSRDTSFAVRAEALYEHAHRKVPPLMRSDGSRNPNLVGTPNTRAALLQTQREAGNQIAGQGTVFGELAGSLINRQANFTFENLRAIRTEVGRALSNFGDYETRLDRSQLKRIYGAISRDIENGLTDISNRAWQRTRLDRNASDYVAPDTARRADAALYEFRRADRYFRQGMERMGRVMDVLEAKTPNEAARKIVRGLSEKTASPTMLREIKRILRPEELNALRGHVIGQLGRGRAGAQMAEVDFNWNTWATDFHRVTDHPAGREFLLDGLPEGVAKKLESFARVVDRMKYYESTKNFSGTAYTGMGAAVLMSPSIMATTAALFGTSAVFGKLLTSRVYLNFQENLMRAQLKAGNTAASNARILAQYAKRLPALAKAQKDPDLSRALQSLSIAINQQLEAQQAP